MRSLATVLFCLFAAAAAAQQTTTETGYWENTSIKLGLNTYDGDNDSISFSAHADWNAHVSLLESDLDFDAGFQKSRGQEHIDQQKLEWTLRRLFRRDSKWFMLVHTWGEHNQSTGIDRRMAIGPGVGLHLIDNKKTRVTLEGGVAITTERHDDGVSDDYTALFFHPSWNYVINDRASIDHDTDARWNSDESDDIRIYSETDLTYQITKKVFALSVGVVVNYDARPVRNHKRTNIETHTTLKIIFSGKG